MKTRKGTISGTFDDKTYVIHFFKLLKICLPSLIPKTIDPKSSFKRTIYPASLATADPDPIAIPTLATFNAGASFTPSPVMATT